MIMRASCFIFKCNGELIFHENLCNCEPLFHYNFLGEKRRASPLIFKCNVELVFHENLYLGGELAAIPFIFKYNCELIFHEIFLGEKRRAFPFIFKCKYSIFTLWGTTLDKKSERFHLYLNVNSQYLPYGERPWIKKASVSPYIWM